MSQWITGWARQESSTFHNAAVVFPLRIAPSRSRCRVSSVRNSATGPSHFMRRTGCSRRALTGDTHGRHVERSATTADAGISKHRPFPGYVRIRELLPHPLHESVDVIPDPHAAISLAEEIIHPTPWAEYYPSVTHTAVPTPSRQRLCALTSWCNDTFQALLYLSGVTVAA